MWRLGGKFRFIRSFQFFWCQLCVGIQWHTCIVNTMMLCKLENYLRLRVYSLGMIPIWMNNTKPLRSCCIKRITSSTYWFLSWDTIPVILDHWFWSVSFQRKIFFNSRNANASFNNLFPGMEMIVGKAGKKDIQSEYYFKYYLLMISNLTQCISQ